MYYIWRTSLRKIKKFASVTEGLRTYVSCKWGHEGKRIRDSTLGNQPSWEGSWWHLANPPPGLHQQCNPNQAHSRRSMTWGCSSCLAWHNSSCQHCRGCSRSRTSTRRPCTHVEVGLLHVGRIDLCKDAWEASRPDVYWTTKCLIIVCIQSEAEQENAILLMDVMVVSYGSFLILQDVPNKALYSL